jgi:hypothetical protein
LHKAGSARGEAGIRKLRAARGSYFRENRFPPAQEWGAPITAQTLRRIRISLPGLK